MQNTPQPPHNPRPIAGTARRLLVLFVTLVLCLNTLPTGAVAEAIDQAQLESSPLQGQAENPALEPADDPDKQPETPAQSAPDEQPVQRIALAFDANMPAAEHTAGSQPMAGIELVGDQTTTLPKNTFAREGYAFAGWSTTPDAAQGAVVTTDEQVLHGAAYELEVVRLLYDDGATRLLPAAAYDAHADAFANVAAERQAQSFDLATSAHDGTLTLYAQWIVLPATSDPTPATPEQTPAEKTDQITLASEDPKPADSAPVTVPKDASSANATRPDTRKDDVLLTAQADDMVTVACATLANLPTDANGVALYNLQDDTAQTFNVGFGNGIFDGTWLKVTITCPKYGFQFDTNQLGNLNNRVEIRNVELENDANGYTTTLSFELYGNAGNRFDTSVHTKYAPLTSTQCVEAIASGWEDSALTVTVTDQGGASITSASSQKLRPEPGTTDVVTVAEHSFVTSSDRQFANAYDTTGGQGGAHYYGSMYYKDLIDITLNIAGSQTASGSAEPVRLNEFRLYVPDERLELHDISDAITPGNPGSHVYAKHGIRTYFTCDKVRHNDNDGKGSYYLFKTPAGKPIYNIGIDENEHDTVQFQGLVWWKVRETDDAGQEIRFLENDKTYAASDMCFSLTQAGETQFNLYGNGTVVRTLPLVEYNDYGFWTGLGSVHHESYRRYWNGELGRYSSAMRVVPGSSYEAARFVLLYRKSYIDDSHTGEYRGPEGDITEVYEFPYEVRPTSISFMEDIYCRVSVIDSIAYEVTDAHGNVRTEHVVKPESGNFAGTTASFSGLAEGERVSKVTIHWDFLWTYSKLGTIPAYASFNYDVTEKDADGNDLKDGQLLRIGYQGTWNETGKTFANTVTNANTDYLYLEVESKRCPWLMKDRIGLAEYSYTYYPRDYQVPKEYTICSHLHLKGLANGVTRTWVDDPRIEFQFSHTNNVGFSGNEWIAFLTGEMTLDKNLAGWTITYGLYDEATGQSREASYHVPQITEDMKLTREVLGLRDTESFTSFALSYDGHWTFENTRQELQTGKTQDRRYGQDASEPGLYDYADLVKNIVVCPRPKSFDGTVLKEGILHFGAVLTHGGTCDREDHHGGGDVAMSAPGQRLPALILYSDYRYVLEGPNFAIKPEENSVHQGGSVVVDFAFNLRYSKQHPAGSTDISPNMPYEGIPEAIYVELTDPHMELDPSNAVFRASLAEHGMTLDDVSVVEIDGKRWIRLAQPRSSTVAWGNKLKRLGNPATMNFPFKIALRAWQGHEPGICNPFGEVWYDLSTYPQIYDGSEEAMFRAVELRGIVADEHGLLGDDDKTTARLWKVDASSTTLEVLRYAVGGVSVAPGKRGVVYANTPMGFVTPDRPSMLASVAINSPDPARMAHDYETVLTLPRNGEAYTWSVTGEEKSSTSEYDLTLTGPASVVHTTLGTSSGISFSYSKDGASFVDAAAVDDAWSEYRYVKIRVAQMDPNRSLEVRFPVTTDASPATTSKNAYLGGTWSYKYAQGGTPTAPMAMSPAVYVMAPSLSLPVTKQLKAPALLNGSGTYDHAYSFAAGAFSFTLSSVGGAPLPGGVGSMTQQVSAVTVSTAANGTQTQTGGSTTFAGLEFDTPGTYTYQLREVIPPAAERLPGVEYNEHVETVTVTVTQDADGRLAARLATGSGGAVTFVNRYALPDTPVGIHAHAGAKTLVRYPGTDAQANAEHVSGFSFVLEERRGDSWVTKYTAAVNDDGSFSFTPLEFTQLDLDKGAPHVYRIREVVPPDAVGAAGVAYGSATETQRAQGGFTKNGITYDQTEYELTITLSDGGGKIDAAQSFVKVRDASGQELTGQTPFGTADGLRFSNTYAATGTAVVQATKDLAGRAWTDDDAFTFKLVPKYRLVGEPDEHGQVVVGTLDTNDPSPMPDGAAELTATATKQHHTTSFSAITFTADQIGKTYMYDVSEVMPASPEENMAYDPSDYGVAITPLRDKGDGTIEVYVSYALNVWNGDGTEDDEHVPIHGVPAFLNKSVGHGTANIFAEKDLEGRAWTADDEFTFVLEADRVENAAGDHIAVTQFPMPNAQGRTAIATADDESAEFGDIHYALADVGRTYYYTIREQLPDGAEGRTKNGITYSSAEQQVRVKVHALAQDSTKVTADVEYQARTLEGNVIWTREPLASFVNTYAAAPATVAEVQVRKLLKAPADLNETGDYDVAYPFDEGAFEFELTPGVNELGEASPMPADPENPEVPLKKIVARASAGLVDAAGRPVADSGMAAFEGAFTFNEVGRYVYVVREVVPAAATNAAGQTFGEHPEAEGPWMLGGTMYTTTAHNVFVDVTDDGMGQLRATVSSRAADGSLTTAPAEFTNRYHVADAPIVLDGIKTINGLAPGAGYTFRLERLDDLTGLVEQGAPVRYASSTADGTFAFAELVFPQTRLGKVTRYRVTEVVPEDAALSRVTYDKSAFEVAIRATDNGDGTMSLTASYERVADIEGQPVRFSVEGIEFVNRIIPAGTATLAVNKELRGRDWTDDDAFEFVAEDATPAEQGAAPLPAADAVANAAAGTPAGEAVRAEFGDIALEPGDACRTLVYKLTERAGSQEGMTYSRQVYYATVDVVDEGDGTLSANVRYYRDAVDEANLLPDGEVPLYTNYQGLVPCRHDPPVRKVVKGSPAKPGTFEFTIVANDPSYPMMEGAKDGSKTVTQTGAGAVEFGEIEFTHPGTYEYTVTEKDTGAAGYTFDKSVWTVRYVVTEVDMHLVAERTFLKDGKQVDAMEATFTNVYAASGTPKQSGSTPGKAGTTPSASGSGGTRLASTGDATAGFVPLIALLGIALIRRGRRLAR